MEFSESNSHFLGEFLGNGLGGFLGGDVIGEDLGEREGVECEGEGEPSAVRKMVFVFQ